MTQWITTEKFLNAKPIDVFRKEQDLDREQEIKAASNGIKNYHVLMRSECQINSMGEAKKAILNISADDYYKLYINGEFVTQGPAPAYPTKYYYNKIDVSKFLKVGENDIAVHLYYQGLINRVWNSGDNRCAMTAALEIGEEAIALDWYYLENDAFSGDTVGYETSFLENFDSNKWDEEWTTADYKSLGYKKCVEAKWADYRLVEQPTKQLAIYRIKPEVMTKSTEGNRIYVDFGKEITGGLWIKAKGIKNDKIIIHCGEELEADGGVRYDMRCNCKYEESWTLRDGISIYENYDYKAFRYVEILLPEDAEILELEAEVRHYPFDDNYANYHGDDEGLRKIFDLCKHTIKIGTQENYVDCPTREKGQYLGDSIITAKCHALLTGSVDMLRKCIDQFAQSTAVCKGMMAVAPGALMQEIGDFSLLWSELLLTDFKLTKDKEFLREYYPVALGIIEHFSMSEGENGLLIQVKDKWNLVDWPENLRDDYDFELSRPVVARGYHNVINALYIGAMINLGKIEETLNIEKTYDVTSRVAEFNKLFFREEPGVYADSENSNHCALHSNVYPYYFGLAAEDKMDELGDFILGKGLCCGTFLSYFVLEALVQNGRKNDAISLILNDSEHGWKNMLREGATTTYEAWGKDQKWNTSLCHPWSCGPIAVLLEEN